MIDTPTLRCLRSEGFEIGAHTMSHRALSGLSRQDLLHEVLGSKVILEQELGAEVRMFSYPFGRYDRRVIECVAQCGFSGARTTRMLALGLEFCPFEIPTSLQAYPHPPFNYIKNLGKRRDVANLIRFVREYLACDNWIELGKKLFCQMMKHGGIWHLYGHSWEIEELKLWEQLEELLTYVSKWPGVNYVCNSEILDLAGRMISEKQYLAVGSHARSYFGSPHGTPLHSQRCERPDVQGRVRVEAPGGDGRDEQAGPTGIRGKLRGGE